MEYRSCQQAFGIPLIAISMSGRAVGVLALGRVAVGLAAVGLVAIGPLATGLVSIGLVSVGLVTIGLVSTGVITVALVGVGAIVAGVKIVGVVKLLLLGVEKPRTKSHRLRSAQARKRLPVSDRMAVSLAVMTSGSAFQSWSREFLKSCMQSMT